MYIFWAWQLPIGQLEGGWECSFSLNLYREGGELAHRPPAGELAHRPPAEETGQQAAQAQVLPPIGHLESGIEGHAVLQP